MLLTSTIRSNSSRHQRSIKAIKTTKSPTANRNNTSSHLRCSSLPRGSFTNHLASSFGSPRLKHPTMRILISPPMAKLNLILCQ